MNNLPKKVWFVITIGALSVLSYGPFQTLKEAKQQTKTIKNNGGIPYLYKGVLHKNKKIKWGKKNNN